MALANATQMKNVPKRFLYFACKLSSVEWLMAQWLELFLLNWRGQPENRTHQSLAVKRSFAIEIQNYVLWFGYAIQTKCTWLIQRYKLVTLANWGEKFFWALEICETILKKFTIFSSNKFNATNPYQYPLNLEDNGRILVLFPTIICHVIDSDSPLYTLSAKQFLMNRYKT